MSRVMLISDTHFGHKNIPKYRQQFETVEEHDEFIFDGICSNINSRDNLWILGDIVFTFDCVHYVERLAKYCHSLNIVLGNHDTDNQERQRIVSHLVHVVDNIHTMTKKGDFWITHFPIHPDELRGRMNIHGHVHSKTLPDNRYVNVCCENVNYKPINYQDIVKGWRGYE